MDRYQNFDAWKLAHALNTKIFRMTSVLPAYSDFRFGDNIRDAADSAERNFPDGFGRFSPGDFARFQDNSKASLLETKNELQVGLDRGYFRDSDVRDATELANRALGALTVLQRYLRSPRARANANRIRDRHIGTQQAEGKKEANDLAKGRTDEPQTDEPQTDEPQRDEAGN